MRAKPATLAIAFAMIVVAGCQSTKSGLPDEQIYLSRGMTASEVKDLLGEPVTARRAGEGQETWIYEKSFERMRPVEAETREVPYYNPVTREMETREEAVTSIETARTTLVTELFIVNGLLAGWRESVREAKDFHGR